VAARCTGKHPVVDIELAAYDQRVVVDAVGGGLRSYSARGHEVLDGYPSGEPSPSGRGQVLVPWPNRLEDGRYDFDGRSYELPLNEPEHRNAIHGLVRWATWEVGYQQPDRVVMEHLLLPQPGYPFTLQLAIEYRLSRDGLRVRTTATNVGSEACPYGSGAHPYLTVGTVNVDPVVMHVPGRTVLESDGRGLPAGSAPVEGTTFDFLRPRAIGSTRLDHAFTDLDRDEDNVARVQLVGPDGRGVALWVDQAYGYLMVFTGDALADVDRRSIAIEPMTCPPNAFRTGDALIRLDPGHSHTGTWGVMPSG
jgi:aldose 1-epimerase